MYYFLSCSSFSETYFSFVSDFFSFPDLFYFSILLTLSLLFEFHIFYPIADADAATVPFEPAYVHGVCCSLVAAHCVVFVGWWWLVGMSVGWSLDR